MATKIYRATRNISGIGKKGLAPGQTIKLDDGDETTVELLAFGAIVLDEKSTAAEAQVEAAQNNT